MNPLAPPATVIVKLGSIAVHAEEMLSDTGHEFDLSTLKSLLNDPEIVEWVAEMNKLALLPVKRTAGLNRSSTIGRARSKK